MDKINFLAKDNFPFFTEMAEMMQQMNNLSAKTALLGATGNYILSGCEEDANGNVSEGYISIAGELFRFAGGAKQTHIMVTESGHTLSAFGVDYPEAYFTRIASFSGAGTDDMRWVDFARVMTNRQLEQQLNNVKEDAVGIMKFWPGYTAQVPKNYMLADGRVLLSEEYTELYQVVGLRFSPVGTPPNTVFNLPELPSGFGNNVSLIIKVK
jgi:hypothetical protein